tara:strand:+ start:321 stop:845 length:525 start_codon:yes stop_codon:yes gene_type:complete
MNSNKNLVLIGMMGSGKSIIGSLLSENLNLEFKDVDSIIEKEAGFKISKIFKKKGENYFRKLEEKITLQLLKSQNTIVSLGGGGFINKNIRYQVLKNHLSFWLNWENSTLINRIIKSKKRPIAFNSNVNEIKKMIMDRSKLYSMANFRVNCENLSKNKIVNKIKDIYEKNQINC